METQKIKQLIPKKEIPLALEWIKKNDGGFNNYIKQRSNLKIFMD